MGTYFNPSNESFTKDKNSELYVDKTGLLEYLDGKNKKKHTCVPTIDGKI